MTPDENNLYLLGDFAYEVLKLYAKYYPNLKVYETSFFDAETDEMACLTMKEYYKRAKKARRTNNDK
ncbi:MAG: hypothetical protein J6U00_03875 [Ruminococcus sp.]|uniref:hypothetical protein n=1 Tax=Ruminococcus sp. TaxID=41978 RepID=UPI001B1900D8|nr:hypothetical protein [Ruminococcus sp.]MBO7473130.1 hypothetical protein [Ruminococcus sp.]